MSAAIFPFSLKLVRGQSWLVKKEDTVKLLLGLHGEITVRKNGMDYRMLVEQAKNEHKQTLGNKGYQSAIPAEVVPR